MPKFRDWRNIEIPTFVVNDKKWADVSWHHDACASADRPLTDKQKDDYPKLILWVESDDRNEREEVGAPKYRLEFASDENEELYRRTDLLYQGESYEECETVVKKVLTVGISLLDDHIKTGFIWTRH